MSNPRSLQFELREQMTSADVNLQVKQKSVLEENLRQPLLAYC